MKKFTLMFALLTLLILPTVAEAKTLIVQVNGMVCDFCARAVTKVFEKEVGIKEEDVSISLDTQEITFQIPEETEISDEQIKQFIHYSGYDLVGFRWE